MCVCAVQVVGSTKAVGYAIHCCQTGGRERGVWECGCLCVPCTFHNIVNDDVIFVCVRVCSWAHLCIHVHDCMYLYLCVCVFVCVCVKERECV